MGLAKTHGFSQRLKLYAHAFADFSCTIIETINANLKEEINMRKETMVTAILAGFYAVCFGAMLYSTYNIGVIDAKTKQLEKEKEKLEAESKYSGFLYNLHK